MQFTKLFLLRVIFILSLFALSGCSDELGNRLEADDFGSAKFTVSSRYSEEELKNEYRDNQVMPWIDSGYRLNGDPLVITVKHWHPKTHRNTESQISGWSPWYGTSKNKWTLSDMQARFPICEFINNDTCPKDENDECTAHNLPIANYPCTFNAGVGLYALMAKPSFNPNLNRLTMSNPSFNKQADTWHVGSKNGKIGGQKYSFKEYDRSGKLQEIGGMIYNYDENNNTKSEYDNGKLYFKIMHRYYNDNGGSYHVSIKSGIHSVNTDPLSRITELVKKFIFGDDNKYGLVRGIYEEILKKPSVKFAINSLLTLFVLFTALLYLSGNIELTNTELIVRVGKFAIVAALLTQFGWSFFNDYLFVYFIYGVDQVVEMITEAGARGPGSSNILSLILAPQTFAKLFSLLFTSWDAFLYIGLFLVWIFIFALEIIESWVIGLSALIMIALMISVGPVFCCFLLFNTTVYLFENWLKHLNGAAIMIIIVSLGVSFIGAISTKHIYASLGHAVQKEPILNMSSSGDLDNLSDSVGQLFGAKTRETLDPYLHNSFLSWWFPNPLNPNKLNKKLQMIVVPVDHFINETDINGKTNTPPLAGAVDNFFNKANVNEKNNRPALSELVDNFFHPENQGCDIRQVIGKYNPHTGFCKAYSCMECRYPDFPFLDPYRDKKLVEDRFNGRFIDWVGLFVVFVAVFVLKQFNKTALGVSKFLSGTSGDLTDIKAATQAAFTIRKNTMLEKARWIAEAKAKSTGVAVGKQVRKGIAQLIDVSLNEQHVNKESRTSTRFLNKAEEKTKKLLNIKSTIAKKVEEKIDQRKITQLSKEALSKDANKRYLEAAEKSTSTKRDQIKDSAFHDYTKVLEDKLNKIRENDKNPRWDVKDTPELASQLASKPIVDLKNEFAKALYGDDKKYKDLTKKERDSVDKIVNSPEILRAAIDAESLKEFQRAYIKAYEEDNEIGVYSMGRSNETLHKLQTAYKRAKENREHRESARLQKGRRYFDQWDALKSGKLKPEEKEADNSRIRREKDNYRKETEREQILYQYEKEERARIARNAKRMKEEAGTDIFRADYLADLKAKDSSLYERAKTVKKLELSHQVRKMLSETNNMDASKPILRGDLYMSKYSSDEEMRKMSDNIRKVEDNFMRYDETMRTAHKYEASQKLAAQKIQKTYEKLEETHDMEDVTNAEELYKKFKEDQIEAGQIDLPKVQQELTELKANIEHFEKAEQVLSECDEHRDLINKEFDSHIEWVNNHRKNAKMEEYSPKPIQKHERKVLKMEDLLHKKNLGK